MFFWIVTIYYLLHYLVVSSLSVFLSPMLTDVHFGAEAEGAKYFVYATAVIEALFVLMCIAVIVLRRKGSPDTIKFWLVTLAAVAIYEVGFTVLSSGAGLSAAELVWPVVTGYVFLRGFMSRKKYAV